MTSIKGNVQKALVAAIAMAGVQMTFAGAEASQGEIEQLRAEVAELRAMIANQKPVVERVERVVVEREGVRFDPKDLKLTTAKGAEFKLYGLARLDANYIIDGNDSDFAAPAVTTGSAKDKLRWTAQVTRLGFDFNTPVGEGNKVGGKVEADFFSNGSSTAQETVRLRHAYLTYNNWLVGQTTSNFLGTHAPETINFVNNSGTGAARRPQVRYTTALAPATKLSVAVEESNTSIAGGNTIKHKLPQLTAKLTQKLGNKGEASVRGMVEHYHVNADGSNGIKETGWGASLGANYNVLPQLRLAADISYVEGSNGILDNATAAGVRNNDVLANKYISGLVGATYKFNDKLRANAIYGTVRSDKDTDFAKANVTANKEVTQAVINFIYNPVKPIEVGVEYIDGKRKLFNGTSYDDDRVGVMARYSF